MDINKKILEAQIELLLSLDYVNVMSGTLEKPEQKSYVLYADVLKLLNEKREELMKRELTKYEKVLLDHVSTLTNRSLNQTIFLFELCKYDFNKLCKLEEKIKNTFDWSCPGDKNAVEKILKLEDKSDFWSFENLDKRYKSKLFKIEQERKELEQKVKSLESK